MAQLPLFTNTQVGQSLDLRQDIKSFSSESGLGLLQFSFGLINKTNKQISQLIAQAWLENNRDLVNEDAIVQLVIDNKLISEGDRKNVIVVIDDKPYKKWSDGGASKKFKPKEDPPQENFVGYWMFFEDSSISGPNPLVTKMYVPFPDKPTQEQLKDSTLELWVKQDPSQAPFYPDPADPNLPDDIVWIPYSC